MFSFVVVFLVVWFFWWLVGVFFCFDVLFVVFFPYIAPITWENSCQGSGFVLNAGWEYLQLFSWMT